MLWIGVDGCPNGWVYIALGANEAQFGVVESLEELLGKHPEAATVLIDIPIGLPDGPQPRACDIAARGILGKRRSSVFSAPQRSVLRARDYAQARQLSVAASGRSLSAQAFGIVPKVREVDTLLRNSNDAARRVREVHPEVCFAMLNGGTPMAHYKKHAEGFRERVGLLEAVYPGATGIVGQAWLWTADRKAARDDVVDAMVVAVTAWLGARAGYRTLPDAPQRDTAGLPMEMVYALPD